MTGMDFTKQRAAVSLAVRVSTTTALAVCLWISVGAWASAADLATIQTVSQRMVKLYGAGGLGRIEAYGSGFLVSPRGHILTVLGPMLDTPDLAVVLANGRRLTGKLIAADSARGLGMIKVDAEDLPCFDLSSPAAVAKAGQPVLAFSNQFNIAAGDEPVSVQQGVVAAVAPMTARQGIHQFTLDQNVYILDATTNNPGAAGGALTDVQGRLLGMIGKEVKSTLTDTWVNYAIPVAGFSEFARSAVAGKAAPATQASNSARQPRRFVDVDLRGIIPLPEVLDTTPAFVDGVQRGSPAEKAGLKVDDLVLFVNDSLVQSLAELRRELAAIPAGDPVRLTVMRGQELTPLEISPRLPAEPAVPPAPIGPAGDKRP